jgi:hypothetical protein
VNTKEHQQSLAAETSLKLRLLSDKSLNLLMIVVGKRYLAGVNDAIDLLGRSHADDRAGYRLVEQRPGDGDLSCRANDDQILPQ